MKNKTTIFIFSILAFFAVRAFSLTPSVKSAGFLYNEATSALNSRYYPGAVRLADTLIKNYPRSLYLPRTYLLKGKAQFALCNFFDAAVTLKMANELLTQKSDAGYGECVYFLARALDESGEAASALDKYNEYCTLQGKNGEPLPKKSEVLFLMGSVYFRAGDFEKAIPFFEYTTSHAPLYDNVTIFEASCKLLNSYNKTGQASKVIALHKAGKLTFSNPQTLGNEGAKKATSKKAKKTSPANKGATKSSETANFSHSDKGATDEGATNEGAIDEGAIDEGAIKLYIADAYSLTHDAKRAFDLYCEVFAMKGSPSAAIALKKAFALFVANENATSTLDIEIVKQKLASLQGKVARELGDDIISEFWTRIGVDAYQKGDDAGALKCFDEAEKSASLQMFLFASLYRAKIAAGRSPTAQSAQDAISIIEQYRSILNDETRSTLFCEANNLLATYHYIAKNYSKALECAKLVVPSTAQTREVIELVLFQKREYEAVIECCEKDATMSPSALKALATSYLRTGDSEKALTSYRALFANGLLNDEEVTDYSVLLFQSGNINEALSVAKNCSNPTARYTEGLCAFLQGDFDTAVVALSAFSSDPTIKDARTKSYALFYKGAALFNLKKLDEAYLSLLNFVASYGRHEFYCNAQYLCALCAKDMGDTTLAIEHCRDAATSKSDDLALKASSLLIDLLWEKGERGDLILNCLSDYFKRFPQSPFIAKMYYKAGLCLEGAGHAERAILHYELAFSKATEGDEVKALSASKLYELYTAKKDFERAATYREQGETANE